MVVHQLHTLSSVSSTLTRTTSFIPGLCNGSTTDFDSVSLGSIPSPGAILKYIERRITQRLLMAEINILYYVEVLVKFVLEDSSQL